MTICIEPSQCNFGDAWIVTATLDKYHRSIVREFFSYTDAQSFSYTLLKLPLEPDTRAMFKRKGL